MSESGIDHSLKRFKQILFIFINLYSLQHIFYWARVYSQRQHSQTCPFETGHTFISETVKTSQSPSQNPAGGSPLCSVGPEAKSTVRQSLWPKALRSSPALTRKSYLVCHLVQLDCWSFLLENVFVFQAVLQFLSGVQHCGLNGCNLSWQLYYCNMTKTKGREGWRKGFTSSTLQELRGFILHTGIKIQLSPIKLQCSF